MQQELCVDTAAVQAMAGGWGASVGELNASAGPARLGLSCQPSAAAVTAAHAVTAAFTRALAAQVQGRAAQAVDADSRYFTNEANSATELAGM